MTDSRNRKRWPGILRHGGWFGGLGIACLLLLAGGPGRPDLAAGDKAEPAAKEKLPPEMALVPPDAFAFVHVRVADLLASEPVAKLLPLFPRETGTLNRELENGLGLKAADVESVTVVLLRVPDLEGGAA